MGKPMLVLGIILGLCNLSCATEVTDEATYLMWIDCSSLDMSSEQLAGQMLESKNLRINEGTIYGNAGEGFIRLNIACLREVLTKGLNRMKKALDSIKTNFEMKHYRLILWVAIAVSIMIVKAQETGLKLAINGEPNLRPPWWIIHS